MASTQETILAQLNSEMRTKMLEKGCELLPEKPLVYKTYASGVRIDTTVPNWEESFRSYAATLADIALEQNMGPFHYEITQHNEIAFNCFLYADNATKE